MKNIEPVNFEKSETKPRLEAKDRYDKKTNKFPYVINYRDIAYDFRDIKRDNGNGLYRMTSESRISRPEPSYIEVDMEGFVVREWN